MKKIKDWPTLGHNLKNVLEPPLQKLVRLQGLSRMNRVFQRTDEISFSSWEAQEAWLPMVPHSTVTPIHSLTAL